MSAVLRRLFALFCLSLLPAALPAHEAERHLPLSVSDAPPLWWALDARAGASLTPGDMVRALQDWLRVPLPSTRPYPPDGLRFGLLAVVPDEVSGELLPQMLHPAVPLEAGQLWPATWQHRHVSLTRGADIDDWQQDWPLAQAQTLSVTLPWPPSGSIRMAWLTLPVARMPQHWPEVDVAFAGMAPRVVPLQPLDSRHVRLDLSVLLAGWQLPAGEAAPATLTLHLTPRPSVPEAQGRWAAWSPTNPAGWQLSWQQPAHWQTGRAHLLQSLGSLLLGTGGHVSTSPEGLASLLSASAGATPPLSAFCGTGGGLLLGVAERLEPVPEGVQPTLAVWRLTDSGMPWLGRAGPGPTMVASGDVARNELPALLNLWRDRALALPARLAVAQPRQLQGHLLGIDAAWLQPVPGRLSWPGDHHFMPCRQLADCAPLPSAPVGGWRTALFAGAAPIRWLSDDGLPDGTPLVDWRQQISQPGYLEALLHVLERSPTDASRQQLRSAMNAYMQAPVAVQGQAIYLDDGPDEQRATGRRGYLAWAAADGSVFLRDADDGALLWAWRPADVARHWLRHLANPEAAYPDRLPEAAWQAWPDRAAAEVSAVGRYLYGLVDGHVLALDLTHPTQPRRLFRLPPTVIPPLRSFTVLTVTASAGAAPRPLLLLSVDGNASAGTPSVRLVLIDGLTGHVLWRAASDRGAGADSAHDRLVASWHSPWQRLGTATGQRLYGVDVIGQVWRLDLDTHPLSVTGALSGLHLVAQLGSPEQPDEQFLRAPSLTWLRDTDGRRRAALTLASEGSQGAVFAFLDGERNQPLRRHDLVQWPAGQARVPPHDSGWLRPWGLSGERMGSAPRWLSRQVVVTSESPEAPAAACAPPTWRTRLHQLPWRRDVMVGGSEAEAVMQDVGTGSEVPGLPIITPDGRLGWAGRPAADTVVSPYRAERVRTGKRLLTP